MIKLKMNIKQNVIILVTIVYISTCLPYIIADKPCAARPITGQSVVCVCDDTYCDEIIREPPAEGRYVAYTSSKDGLRFQKSIGVQSKYSDFGAFAGSAVTLILNPNITYQEINGFGGSVTDAAGINWKSLPDVLQKYLIDSYFSDKGLEYNMIRTPIGGSDFSTRVYTYQDQPEDDPLLSNFTLAFEDYEYKIPMIKACLEAATSPVKIVATTWSPPIWMKSNGAISGFSRLKEEYYQTYADYHYKYLEKYAAENISLWAITTTNEPVNGLVPVATFNSLGWKPADMGRWIITNLGPTIRNSTFKDLKIIALDDQRYSILLWFALMVRNREVLNWIDGVAVHYYGDNITPPEALSYVTKNYPDKFLLATEACEGSFPWNLKKVFLGSWDRANNYITDIINDLNYAVTGWIDWNMCLNAQGGPNWANNFVDSPIIVYPEKREFIKQPMFYALGHFSKFVPAGSRRIQVTEKKGLLAKSLKNVAFITPKNTIATVIYNNQAKQRKVSIRLGSKEVVIGMRANSITTVEIPYI